MGRSTSDRPPTPAPRGARRTAPPCGAIGSPAGERMARSTSDRPTTTAPRAAARTATPIPTTPAPWISRRLPCNPPTAPPAGQPPPPRAPGGRAHRHAHTDHARALDQQALTLQRTDRRLGGDHRAQAGHVAHIAGE